jgi:hypothetical protein
MGCSGSEIFILCGEDKKGLNYVVDKLTELIYGTYLLIKPNPV